MKKLFDKDPVWFSVLWIVLYVVGFANADAISDSIGIPKVLTAPIGLVLSGVLYLFLRRHRLLSAFGLCRLQTAWKNMFWFLPLVVISSVNLWNGVALQCGIGQILLHIVSMCCVGFLEEVIFRGLLLKAMARSNLTAAVLVSSLTFGIGHIVNLLTGAPVLDTLLQIVYATAIGFCYAAIFLAGGSLVPCILSHALVNSMSIFALPADAQTQMCIAAAQTVLGVSYGLWLLYRNRKKEDTHRETFHKSDSIP